MSDFPPCPQCRSAHTYEDVGHYVCPECAHEWTTVPTETTDTARVVVRDACGSVLHDGDTVSVIKDLKVRGTSSVAKVGTRVKGIRLTDGDHDIDCKIDDFGAMQLQSAFVRKA